MGNPCERIFEAGDQSLQLKFKSAVNEGQNWQKIRLPCLNHREAL
jgi:hypothetical protein